MEWKCLSPSTAIWILAALHATHSFPDLLSFTVYPLVFPFSFCVSILMLALHHLNRDDLTVDLKSISCLFEKGLLGKFFCNRTF